jgi:OFA family oxalate/formate antiporter-like MFS transporter
MICVNMDKRALAVLIACFCTVFTSYAIRYGYGILLPEMLPSLVISKTEAGVIYASFFIAYTVFSPLLGIMGDRYEVRWLLTLFVAILGIGAFLMAYSSSITQASLFFVLAGIGSAACWAPVMALAQRWTSDKHRGKTLAFVDVGSSLGIIGTSTAVPMIVVAHSWRTGWMSLGILGLAVALVDFLMVRSPPPEPPQPRQTELGRYRGEPLRATYMKLLRDARFWFIGLAYLLTGFSVIIPFTFLSTYAAQELALTYEMATRLVTVIGIGAVVGKITLGPLSDKVGRIKVMMLCAVLIAGGSLGMAYGRVIILISFTAIFSLGYGALWSMYAASASDYFSKESAGSIVGLWTVYLGIGSILSPIIAGWIADTSGTLAWSFVLAAVGALISLLLLLPVGRAPSTSSPVDQQ